jgi:hypothetical protein
MDIEGGSLMAEATRSRRVRRTTSRAVTRLSPAMHLYYPIVREGGGSLDLLRVNLAPRGRALVVFSSRPAAREALPRDVFPDDCDTRVCSSGELVSLLFGPYRDVDWVLLDPRPGRLREDLDAGTNLLGRGRFVDQLLGNAIPGTVSAG